MRMPSISSRALSCGDEREHFFGGDVGGRRDQVAVDAKLGAGLHLVADVNLRCRHVAHQHRRQSRPDAVRGQLANLFGHFLLDGGGNRRAIENLLPSFCLQIHVSLRSAHGPAPGAADRRFGAKRGRNALPVSVHRVTSSL